MAGRVGLRRKEPAAFAEYRERRKRRTGELTRQAIEYLTSQGITNIPLDLLSQTTRELDEIGRGLSPRTITRNPDAAAMFRLHSERYQQKVKTQGSQSEADLAEAQAQRENEQIHQLESEIEILQEKLETTTIKLKKTKQHCDELEQKNIKLIAQLTKLLEQQASGSPF